MEYCQIGLTITLKVCLNEIYQNLTEKIKWHFEIRVLFDYNGKMKYDRV